MTPTQKKAFDGIWDALLQQVPRLLRGRVEGMRPVVEKTFEIYTAEAFAALDKRRAWNEEV